MIRRNTFRGQTPTLVSQAVRDASDALVRQRVEFAEPNSTMWGRAQCVAVACNDTDEGFTATDTGKYIYWQYFKWPRPGLLTWTAEVPLNGDYDIIVRSSGTSSTQQVSAIEVTYR